MSITVIIGALLVFAYLFFYINSKQYLRRENFSSYAALVQGNRRLAENFESGITVSWPGGVVSPPPFGKSNSIVGY